MAQGPGLRTDIHLAIADRLVTNHPSSAGLARSFWIPATSLVAVEIYVSQFDGRGSWATAPLFLVPLALSVVIAGAGFLQCLLEWRARSNRVSTMVLTFLAALPFFWLLVRRHLV